MFLRGKSLLDFCGHLQGVFFNSIVANRKILIRKPLLSCVFTGFTDLMDHPSSSIITQVSRDEEASAPLRDRGELRESLESAHVKLWSMSGARRPLHTASFRRNTEWLDLMEKSVFNHSFPHIKTLQKHAISTFWGLVTVDSSWGWGPSPFIIITQCRPLTYS